MSAQPTTRPHRVFWLDPRFAIGILLVAASVVGVWAVVHTADRTTTVLAAASAIAPGDRVTTSDLRRVQVRLGDSGKRYMTAERMPAAGVVVTRAVGPGELLPVAAVGDADSVTSARVVLSVRGPLAASVIAGSVVDVWSAAAIDGGGFGPPAVLAEKAAVVRVVADDGMVRTGDGVSVEVQVPRRSLPAVLQAQANGDAVSVIAAAAQAGS
ncbi:hypothetical protein OSC27_02245 [Microbacterium sp. STN6]|uniref:hypothetical protein n=1 Tax=Microbacterium sp. STN6 TaxID=2995588 RepID=UPI002260D64F|nr:hypothetical protein [Microbacterium sp. STN6]MCX7521094.1 hypothetical protein [Microbacterium sp. STN6]